MKKALLIHPSDNVAVLTQTAAPGDDICYKRDGVEYHVTSIVEVPIYHKVSVCDIAKGERIIKYGQVIAEAFCDIPAGSHVHNHNADSHSLIEAGTAEGMKKEG